jgi:hypothetical protein
MRWTPNSAGLRWLAGGSHLDIALAHCVSISIFFRFVDETICDIDDTMTLEFGYEGEDFLKRVRMGFTRGRSPIYGCAGAIGGISIQLRAVRLSLVKLAKGSRISRISDNVTKTVRFWESGARVAEEERGRVRRGRDTKWGMLPQTVVCLPGRALFRAATFASIMLSCPGSYHVPEVCYL